MSIIITLNYIAIIWVTYKTVDIGTLGNKFNLLKMCILLLLASGLDHISSDLQQINKTLQQIVKIKNVEE
jgi:hypothetical protein